MPDLEKYLGIIVLIATFKVQKSSILCKSFSWSDGFWNFKLDNRGYLKLSKRRRNLVKQCFTFIWYHWTEQKYNKCKSFLMPTDTYSFDNGLKIQIYLFQSQIMYLQVPKFWLSNKLEDSMFYKVGRTAASSSRTLSINVCFVVFCTISWEYVFPAVDHN